MVNLFTLNTLETVASFSSSSVLEEVSLLGVISSLLCPHSSGDLCVQLVVFRLQRAAQIIPPHIFLCFANF